MRRRFALTAVAAIIVVLSPLSLFLLPRTMASGGAAQAVTVPIGHVGDQVEYDLLEHYEWHEAGSSPYVDDTHERLAVRINRTLMVPDNLGQLHAAVEVEYTGFNVITLRYGSHAFTREVVDLETRHALLRERTYNEYSGLAQASRIIGPRFLTGWTPADAGGEERMLPTSTELKFQGRTYAAGTEVASDLATPLDLWVGASGPAAHVTTRGMIGDVPAIAIEWTDSYLVDSPDEQGEGQLRSRVWVSDRSPYPLLIEEDWWENATWNGVEEREYDHLTYSLVRVEPGALPIPWATSGVAHPYPSVDPTVERSPSGQLYPADGSDGQLPYPVGRAVANIQGDPSLLRFTRWRLDNPGAQLVGMSLRPTEDGATPASGSGPEWTFTFAAKGGDEAYRVRTTLLADTARPVNADLGAFALRMGGTDLRLPLDVAAVAPVTLAEATRLWNLALGGGDAQVPTHILWGYGFLERCAAPSTEASVCPLNAGFEPLRGLRTLDVGTSDGVRPPPGTPRPPATGVADPGPTPMLALTDGVEVDVQRGWLLAHSTVTRPWTFQSWALEKVPAHSATPTHADTTIPPSVPNTALAAAASTSLLALLAMAYFWPTLRDFGARALLLIPLYAKLRKDVLLDNRLRDAIASAINTEPGINASDVHRRVGAGWSTVVYHLGVLERNALVTSIQDGRHKRFFPAVGIDHGRRGQIAALRNPRTRDVYELLLRHPGMARAAIAEHFGLSKPGVTWHLERLAHAGLLAEDRLGRRHRYSVRSATGPAPTTK